MKKAFLWFLWLARLPARGMESVAKQYDDMARTARLPEDAERYAREAVRCRREAKAFAADFPELRFGVLLLGVLGGLAWCIFHG